MIRTRKLPSTQHLRDQILLEDDAWVEVYEKSKRHLRCLTSSLVAVIITAGSYCYNILIICCYNVLIIYCYYILIIYYIELLLTYVHFHLPYQCTY